MIIDFRYVGWRTQLLRDTLPVDTFEELVLHDVFDLEAHVWIGNENLSDNVSRHRRQVLRQNDAARVHHLYDHLRRHRAYTQTVLSDSNLHGLRSERREPTNHFAYQNTEAPYISLVPVIGSNDHFGGRVRRRSAVGPRLVSFQICQLLGEAKVDKFNVPASVQKNVLRFQIPEDYVTLMQLLNRYEYLS